jgi:hypothetical protein
MLTASLACKVSKSKEKKVRHEEILKGDYYDRQCGESTGNNYRD